MIDHEKYMARAIKVLLGVCLLLAQPADPLEGLTLTHQTGLRIVTQELICAAERSSQYPLH